MKQYYYLVSSLPELVLGEPPPISLDEFLFSCSTVLEPEDLEELRRISEGREMECTSAFMQAWREADCQLRNAAATIRAQRRNIEARPYLREHGGFRVWVEKGVADAFAKPDPAEREMALDRLRWRILDELCREDPFGSGRVLAFGLKLRMTDRWARMDADRGRSVATGFVEHQAETAGAALRPAQQDSAS